MKKLLILILLSFLISGCVENIGTYQRTPTKYYRTYTLPSGRTLIEELTY